MSPLPSLLALAFLAGALAAPAGAVDWKTVGDERVPRIVTTNEDGSEKWTKLWLAVVDGEPYIRTGNSRWQRNITRDPKVKLEIGGTLHLLRAEPVTDEALRERIRAAMRKKYGWQDALVHPFGLGGANLMHLAPRAE